MTVELKRDDIGLLISLLTRDMDRIGEVKEKYGFCDPLYSLNGVLTEQGGGE